MISEHTEELQLPSLTDTYLDEKALGLPWTNNQNAPILQYKQLGFNKTPKPTKQNTYSANNDNLQYKPTGIIKMPRLTKENTNSANNDNLQHKPLESTKPPKPTKENKRSAKSDNLSVAETETRFETRSETFHDTDNVIGRDGETFTVEVTVGKWELEVKVDGNEVC